MRFFEADDYEVIAEWFHMREMKAPPFVYLPKIGFIEDWYAAGFLVQSDTPVASIDFIIANPETPLKKRKEAIRSVVLMLMQYAKTYGYKSLRCTTDIRSIGNLALDFHFREVGDFRTFFKEL